MKRKMKRNLFLKIVLILCAQIITSCTAINQGVASFRIPKGFLNIGDSILVENAIDKPFAERIKVVLPSLIDSVERKHFQKFKKTFPIYLCHSNESFCKYAGSKYPGPRAKVTPKGFYISPRLDNSQDWYQIVYHELSHVIMLQNLGTYRYFFTPLWFHEGFATYTSNGGGSGNVSDSAAISEILKGRHFYPCANDNLLYSKSFSNDNIPPWIRISTSNVICSIFKGWERKGILHFFKYFFREEIF